MSINYFAIQERMGLATKVSAPPQIAVDKDNIKSVTEERVDDQGRRIRVTRKIRLRVVSEKVSVEVASRQGWCKFGDAANDPPGPNISSTIIGEPVFLNLSQTKDLDDGSSKATVVQAKNIQCRYCQGAHWSAKCPFKSTFADEIKDSIVSSSSSTAAPGGGSKYIPPALRRSMEEGGPAPGTTGHRDNPNTVRISNLSEMVTEGDLRDLVGFIAAPARVYVVKDQRTNLCRGSAFVSFHKIEDAERVIKRLEGHMYGNMIIHVEMAKPQQP